RVDEHVRVLVQHARHIVGVLGVVAEVDGDEGRLGVAGDPPLERVVELLPGGDAGVVEGPLGVGLQLVPALVVRRGRLPEGLRIAAVDGDRHAELARALEHRIEARIVDRQEVDAVGRGVAEAEALGDLEADGAHLVCRRQLSGHRLAVVGDAADQPEVGRGEDGDAPAALGRGGQLALQGVLGWSREHPRQVDHPVDPPLVHQADGALDAVGRDVRVDVDPVEAVPARRRIARGGRAVAADHEKRQREDQAWEPWEGSHALPRWTPPGGARLRPRDQRWEPWEGYHALPRWTPPGGARLRPRDQRWEPWEGSHALPRWT